MDAALIQKANAERSVLRNLKPLEELSIATLLKSTAQRHDFFKLPSTLLDAYVKKLLTILEDPYCKVQPDITYAFVESLINSNLRTFSTDLICKLGKYDCSQENMTLLWKRLKKSCRKLNALTVRKFSVRQHYSKFNQINDKRIVPLFFNIRDLACFPSLQKLCFLDSFDPENNIPLSCGDIQQLSTLDPNLRSLEIAAEFKNLCCQDHLCQLTNLEELAMQIISQRSYALFKQLWAKILTSLPHLRITSDYTLKETNEHTRRISDALAELIPQEHKQPLQLVSFSVANSYKEATPLHLLTNVTKLDLAFVSDDHVLALVNHFGPRLKTLQVCAEVLDARQLVLQCPVLEELYLDFCYRADGSGDLALPSNHFCRLRSLKLLLYESSSVSAEFLKLAVESPHIEVIHVRWESCENRRITNAVIEIANDVGHHQKRLKHLRELELEIFIDETNCGRLGEAIKTLIASAPLLTYALIHNVKEREDDEYRSLLHLGIDKFCNQLSGLQCSADGNCVEVHQQEGSNGQEADHDQDCALVKEDKEALRSLQGEHQKVKTIDPPQNRLNKRDKGQLPTSWFGAKRILRCAFLTLTSMFFYYLYLKTYYA